MSLDLGFLPIGYAGVDALVQLINHGQVAVEVYLVDWYCEDDDGLTPLMHAVQKNALDCVRFLMDEKRTPGACLRAAVQKYCPPLSIAAANGHVVDCMEHTQLADK